MASSASPTPWTHTFEARAHDLDNTGTVGAAALVRLTETQRWHVFAGPLRGIFGRAVVRAQSIEMRASAGFGEALEMEMWVARVGRTSALFGHTVRALSHPDVPVAELSVTIVATDATGRPEPIGEVARAALVQREALETVRDFPAHPEAAYRHRFPVQHHDLDLLQHINQARYTDFVNSARHAAVQAEAFPADFDGARGLARMDLAYDDEARLGAALSAYSWVVDANTVGVELCRDEDGKVITRARLTLNRYAEQPVRARSLLWEGEP